MLFTCLCVLSSLLRTGISRRIVKSHGEQFPETPCNLSSPSRSLGELSGSRGSTHRVLSLPGLTQALDFTHYSGQIAVDASKNGKLFYWLFEPRNSERLPLLIWLNGGPGCSSMDGLWLELGPFRLHGDKQNQVRLNPFSWHTVANLLFIDQPVGTGLATSGKDGLARDDQTINKHMYTFLTKFYALHPQYIDQVASAADSTGRKLTKPLFFSGESHAGHYIPCMSVYIKARNSEAGRDEIFISLEGIILGNPWIDPILQYDSSDLALSLGLISKSKRDQIQHHNTACQDLLRRGKFNQRVCFQLLDMVVDSTKNKAAQKVLMYDARKFVRSAKTFPPGHEDLERYLNSPDVRRAVHVDSAHEYVECADPPFFALAAQDGKGVTEELVALLDSGLRVLVYSGQFDLVCNYLSTEKALDQLKWRHQPDWQREKSIPWTINGTTVGKVRSYANLQSLLVLDAGHMVPMDVPEVALKMVADFISSSLTPPFSSLPVSAVRTQTPTRQGRKKLRKTSRRLSRDSKKHSYIFPQQLSILHLLPMNGRVLIRIRIHWAPPGMVTHHSTHKSKHSNATIGHIAAVQREFRNLHGDIHRYLWYLWVEPLAREIPILHECLHGHKQVLDIAIDGIADGVDHHFSVRRHEESNRNSSFSPKLRPHASSLSRRVATVRTGCYSPTITQCCGKGECTALTRKEASNIYNAKCYCDLGYSGEFCELYRSDASGGEGGVGGAIADMSHPDSLCPAHQLRPEPQVAYTILIANSSQIQLVIARDSLFTPN